MKNIKPVVISTALLASVLSGCGSNGAKESAVSPATTQAATPATTAQAENPLKEHMDISISWWGVGAGFEKHDELLQKLENDFNVTFKAMDIGWDNYVQKNQVWAASGQLPDIITGSAITDTPATYTDWVNQKLIRALPDDLSKFPNVQNVAKLPDVQSVYKSGKLYAIPRLTYPNNDMWALDRAIWVRKDWMEKLGIQDPKNFDEFTAMMKAFAEKDPDGNGKNDTVGLVINNMSFLTQVFQPAFPQIGNNSWLKEDGKWIPPYASKQMNSVVTQARKLYVENGLDKDFAVQKSGEGNQKFYQGKAGALALSLSNLGTKTEWEKANPGKNFYDSVKPLHLWPSADATTYRFTTTTYWSESMFSAKVDDKKMDRILRIYNYLLSPEGKTLFNYGIEGKDYKKDGDKIVITRPKDEKTGNFVDPKVEYPSMDIIMHLAAWGQESLFDESEANKAIMGEATMKVIKDEYKWQLDKAKPIPTAFEISTLSTPAKDKIGSINLNDDLTKVILGKDDPVKMWQETVKGYDSKGLQDAVNEVTGVMAKLNK